jgi:hypothetical protein
MRGNTSILSALGKKQTSRSAIALSALGQKPTYALQQAMSALLRIATAKAKFRSATGDARFGPKADIRLKLR